MAKHRKTRQQKMVADQRHVVYHLETSPAQADQRSEKKSDSSFKLNTIKSAPITTSYAYVEKDLKKTALITSAIIIAQIFLFIIINQM